MKITFASSAALIVFAGLQFATALPAAVPEDAATPVQNIVARQAPDGTCGNVYDGNNGGYSCGGGMCCSQWGWCGTSADHCGKCKSQLPNLWTDLYIGSRAI